MTERDVLVVNKLGIHARPASMIVQTAKSFESDISLVKDGTTADAKSIMSVMMLAAAQNSKILIRGEGADEEKAVDAIAKHFDEKFGEE